MSNFKPTLANEFAYSTECGLATLEGLLVKKSSPKHEVRRQANIVLRQLRVCREHQSDIEWGHELHPHFSRVQKLVVPSGSDADLQDNFNAWMTKEKT